MVKQIQLQHLTALLQPVVQTIPGFQSQYLQILSKKG